MMRATPKRGFDYIWYLTGVTSVLKKWKLTDDGKTSVTFSHLPHRALWVRRQGEAEEEEAGCDLRLCVAVVSFFLFLVIPFLPLMWHVISRGVSGGQGRRRRMRRRLECASRISKALLRPGCCRTSELNGHFCPEHNRMWLQRTDEGGKWVFDTDALHTQQAHVLINEPDDLSSPWQSFMWDSRCAWMPSPLPFNI